MSREELVGLALALIVTVVLEAIPAFFFAPRKERFMASVICNAATNPALNLILLALRHLGAVGLLYGASVGVLEIAVVFIEAALYRLLLEEDRKKCLLYSLGVNALSFLFGLILL